MLSDNIVNDNKLSDNIVSDYKVRDSNVNININTILNKTLL